MSSDQDAVAAGGTIVRPQSPSHPGTKQQSQHCSATFCTTSDRLRRVPDLRGGAEWRPDISPPRSWVSDHRPHRTCRDGKTFLSNEENKFVFHAVGVGRSDHPAQERTRPKGDASRLIRSSRAAQNSRACRTFGLHLLKRAVLATSAISGTGGTGKELARQGTRFACTGRVHSSFAVRAAVKRGSSFLCRLLGRQPGGARWESRVRGWSMRVTRVESIVQLHPS